MSAAVRYGVVSPLAGALIATPLASFAVLVVLSLEGTVRGWEAPPLTALTCWWSYARHYGFDPRFTDALLWTMLPAFAIGYGYAALAARRFRSRAGSSR